MEQRESMTRDININDDSDDWWWIYDDMDATCEKHLCEMCGNNEENHLNQLCCETKKMVLLDLKAKH